MFGQHRNRSIDEIDRRGAFLRLFVDDGTLGDVVRHVGNVDADLEKFVFFPNRQGIVEVLCVVRVDGASPYIAEILALSEVFRRHLARNLVGSLLDLLRIAVGQAVLRQNRVHFGVVFALLTENVDDLAHHIAMLRVGPLRDAHQCLVVAFSAHQLAFRDENVLHNEIVLRHEEGDVAIDAQRSYKRVLRPLQNLQNLRLANVVPTACHQRKTHAVTVLRPQRIALRDENRLVGAVGNNRILAVQLPDEATFLHLSAHVQTEGVVALFLQEIVPCHLVQHAECQHFQWMRVESEFAENILQFESRLRITHEQILQHLFHIGLAIPASARFFGSLGCLPLTSSHDFQFLVINSMQR